MSEEISEAVETVQNIQDLYKKFTEYLKQSGKNTSDTKLEVKNLTFNVGKGDTDYVVSMECDLSLSPKAKEKSELAVTTT